MRKLPLMKQVAFVIAFILGACVSSGVAQTDRLPAFTHYPALIEKVRAKDINCKGNPEARRFRTVLRESLHEGVDFAGHYIVASWGCGASCLVGAVIDARTGVVYWPKQLAGIYTMSDDPIIYKPESRMIVISVGFGINGDIRRDNYYEWKFNRLRLVRSIVHNTT